MKNNVVVKLKQDYKQVCVWPGTIVGKDNIKDFEDTMRDDFNVRVQYVGEVVHGKDGQNDLLFGVHQKDIMQFAIKRLTMGISWLEDYYSNGRATEYPEHISEYKTW